MKLQTSTTSTPTKSRQLGPNQKAATMRLSIAAALAVATAQVQAFKDTSPFLMFSTSPLPESLQDASRSQLQSSSSVLQTTKDFLKTCPSEIYFIVSQRSVSAPELSKDSHHLKMAVGNPGVKTRYSVSEVTGLKYSDTQDLVKFLQDECGATTPTDAQTVYGLSLENTGTGVVAALTLNELTGEEDNRSEMLSENDATLYSVILKDMPKGYRYTFIYTTTPADIVIDAHKPVTYDPEFMEAFHMDLKRDYYASRRENETNSTDFRPLFEKYEYFNPGLFMGLSVSLLLLAILSVGISAVSSLEVSYGAFDKEMGPAAQKKQQ